jgi:hypothetical protein
VEELLTKIRTNVHLQSAPIIVAAEGNLGLEADHLYEFLARLNLKNVFHMSERPDQRAGVQKTERNTNEYVKAINRAMLLQGLSFADVCFSLERSVEEERSRLRVMMENYSLVPKTVNRRPGARESYYATGKLKGAQDDLLIAAMMCIYWRERFWSDRARYGQLHQRIGAVY